MDSDCVVDELRLALRWDGDDDVGEIGILIGFVGKFQVVGIGDTDGIFGEFS